MIVNLLLMFLGKILITFHISRLKPATHLSPCRHYTCAVATTSKIRVFVSLVAFSSFMNMKNIYTWASSQPLGEKLFPLLREQEQGSVINIHIITAALCAYVAEGMHMDRDTVASLALVLLVNVNATVRIPSFSAY